MARHTYTAEELRHLRDSPLVQKPDGLPSIDQWIDPPQDRDATQRKTSGRMSNGRSNDDSGPMGNFGSQRPSLLQTRQTRASGDDIVLGPPKTSFASARNIRRTDEGDEKISLTNNDGDEFGGEPMSARTRNYNDEDGARRRGFGMDDKERDGWTTARKGRGYENRPSDKDRPFGRGIRERGDRQAGAADDANRRNGFNNRDETRWTREGDDRRPTRTPGREGGWRDRERRPEYTRDAPPEKEPEWMDEPTFDEEPVARTAAEFEKWKARMKGQKAEEPKEQDIPAQEKSPTLPKLSTSLFADPSFGTWGDAKKHETSARPEPTPNTPATNKKASRFASMFAPKDEPRPAMPEPASEPTPPASAPVSADQEAFQRMLMKLRATSVGSPQDGAPTARPSSQAPPPGLGPQSAGPLDNRSSPNPLIQHMLQSKTDSRPGSTIESTFDKGQGPPQNRPSHSRQESQNNMPSRDTKTPETHSLHAILAGQSQPERKTPVLSKDSEFLLNLIQMKSANRPQQAQHEPDPNFQLFLDQPPRAPAQGPPPPSRTQPPMGHMQAPEHPFSPARGNNEPHEGRRPATQPPPGFFDGPPPPQQRRPPGFGPPPPMPEFFHHDPNHPPPPGFMAGMHHPHHPNPHAPPPGIPGLPNMFASPPPPHMLHQQQHQQGQQQQQRGPPGLPGGDHSFGPGPGMAPPPGFSQGFMPPPGFAGPMPPHPHGIGRARMDLPPGVGLQMQQDRGNTVGRGR
ncbi:hypothetical protein K461DRAFT_324333 [Myriangium duriaei CBS 260.36]|uniref:Uncharacterized protein n=1 Tax=Myriangium duriaei CBS 260.36 TaxID=1168546 RepID=A0A9P4MGE7_9PEZI|nr:hypothetical protein K461DRAFT_324333 [Myriangium duriaei CBS 260.36]